MLSRDSRGSVLALASSTPTAHHTNTLLSYPGLRVKGISEDSNLDAGELSPEYLWDHKVAKNQQKRTHRTLTGRQEVTRVSIHPTLVQD